MRKRNFAVPLALNKFLMTIALIGEKATSGPHLMIEFIFLDCLSKDYLFETFKFEGPAVGRGHKSDLNSTDVDRCEMRKMFLSRDKLDPAKKNLLGPFQIGKARTTGDLWKEMEWSLSPYLGGQNGYNASLREWFEDS